MRLSLRTVPPAPTATPHGRGPAWGASRTRAGSTLAEAEPSPPTGRLRATAQPVTSHAGPEEADAADIPGHSRTSRWAICFLKNCALLLSEQPLIRVIYKEPGARVALERGRVEMDGPAQRGAHPGSEDAAPRCAGELGRGSRGRRAADSGRPRVGRVESAVGSPPQPCVFVASFSRDREDWARGGRAGRAASAAGETRGQPCVGAAAAALTAAHVRLPRRVRAPQPRVGGTGGPELGCLWVTSPPPRGPAAWRGPRGVAPPHAE